MPVTNPMDYLLDRRWLESLLPDFVLAFAFFTSVIYAAVGPRFGQQRPAVAISATMGMALSIGLVWWEQINGYSIRNLGPVAVGFAILLLAGVIYQAVRRVGGNWSGAGIAIGACLLIGWTLGAEWPVRDAIVQTLTTVLLLVGIAAFLLHRRGAPFVRAAPELNDLRHDMTDLHGDQGVSDRLTRGFRRLRRKAKTLFDRPEESVDVFAQLRRMLPAEGWLTERMARLREKSHHMRAGHIARIADLKKAFGDLPAEAKRKAAKEIAARYEEQRLDHRLERLDRAVAETEKRIKELTRQAQEHLRQHNNRRLVDVLGQASKLQAHNAKLLRTITRTEQRLMKLAEQAAKQAQGVAKKDAFGALKPAK